MSELVFINLIHTCFLLISMLKKITKKKVSTGGVARY